MIEYPFPHIILDDFFNQKTLDDIVSEWPKTGWISKSSKTSVKKNISDKSKYGKQTLSFIKMLHSKEFISTLNNKFNKTLFCEDRLYGAGLHYIEKGGFLKIHTDFNWNVKLEKKRALNLIVFLNDWKPGDGGELELWDKDSMTVVKKIEPVMNRLVVFESSDRSLHGHPHPCNKERKSIATYYYENGVVENNHSTIYYDS